MGIQVDEHTIPAELIEALLAGYARHEPATAWVQWVWRELARGGLVPPGLNPHRIRYPDHLIQLGTLCRCVDRFSELELSTAETVEPADLADLPQRWALSHSQLHLATGIDLDVDTDDEDGEAVENNTSWLSAFLITEQDQDLVRTVAETLGVDVLFASLWAVGHNPADRVEDEFGDLVDQPVTFPLSSEELSDILNCDMTFEKLRMVEWVQEWCGVQY